MMWKVVLRRQGVAERTYITALLGTVFVQPQAHRCVSWFTTDIYRITSISPSTGEVIADYSHIERHHLDVPRDPARLPQ